MGDAETTGLGTQLSAMDAFGDDRVSLQSSCDAWEAVQEAGDILVVPPEWWRQPRFEDRSLAVLSEWLPLAARHRTLATAATAAGFLAAAGRPGDWPIESDEVAEI